MPRSAPPKKWAGLGEAMSNILCTQYAVRCGELWSACDIVFCVHPGWEGLFMSSIFRITNNSSWNKIQNVEIHFEIRKSTWNPEIHFEIQKSTLKSRNPRKIQKSNLKSEIHVKSSGFRNLVRRDSPWRTPQPRDLGLSNELDTLSATVVFLLLPDTNLLPQADNTH